MQWDWWMATARKWMGRWIRFVLMLQNCEVAAPDISALLSQPWMYQRQLPADEILQFAWISFKQQGFPLLFISPRRARSPVLSFSVIPSFFFPHLVDDCDVALLACESSMLRGRAVCKSPLTILLISQIKMLLRPKNKHHPFVELAADIWYLWHVCYWFNRYDLKGHTEFGNSHALDRVINLQFVDP